MKNLESDVDKKHRSTDKYILLHIFIMLAFGVLIVEWLGTPAVWHAGIGFACSLVCLGNANLSTWNPLADLEEAEKVPS